jgi:hypothetical protein
MPSCYKPIPELQFAQSECILLSRIDEELAVVRRIQELFLARMLRQPYGWQLATFSRGAQAIGGDFFDCINCRAASLVSWWPMCAAKACQRRCSPR